MKITYVQPHTLESTNEGGKNILKYKGYPNLHCRILNNNGHECELVSLKPTGEVETSQHTYGHSVTRFPVSIGKTYGNEISLKLLNYLVSSDSDVIHIRGYKEYNVLPLIPVLSQFKNVLIHHHGSPSQYSNLSFKHQIAIKLLRCADSVAALNNEEIENLRRIGFPENKLHYLPNAVDTQMFYPIKKKIASNYLCMDHTNRYVTYIGRVVGVKNVPVLVKAFSEVVDKIPKAKLLIVGGGDQDEIHKVKKTIRDEQINTKVNILGQLSHEQMVYYYNISDIIVSPSSSEGLGMTALEAAVCKTPFIGTMAHDSSTIFTNSHNCSLVDSINPDTISSEIMKLIQNEEYAEKIKQNAYDDVISEYSVKSILKKVNEVYTDTISS